MKEATGELNVTVIVVIIVALLSFFFFGFIWPGIRGNFRQSTKCDEAICKCLTWNKGTCTKHTCYYRDESGKEHNITCAWKG